MPFEINNVATGESARLAMQALWLTGRILPVGARLIAVHSFRSAESQPIEAVYAFGLPRDTALRRFKIVGEGFQAHSELRPVAEAQETYEAGVAAGHLSTLARQYRDGRVNLSVGNIRPGELVKVFLELVAGVEIRDDGLRFRFPFTLAPVYHGQMRVAEPTPGEMELELPYTEFGDLLLPRWMSADNGLHAVGFDIAVAMKSALGAVESPSHLVRVTKQCDTTAQVQLATARDVPNRDLVLDVRTPKPEPRVCGGTGSDGSGYVTLIVPSPNFGEKTAAPRNVVFILDRSGSMHGLVMEQAKTALDSCLATLSDQDYFGVVAFDDTTELFAKKMLPATPANRQNARQFLHSVEARGGTEMAAGITAGIELGRERQSEILLLTDGQVGATEELLAQLRQDQLRIHCVGIGAASQDRFLTLLARETGGQCRSLNPRERVDQATLEVFAGMGGTLAKDLRIQFSDLPGARIVAQDRNFVLAGAPLVLMIATDAPGSGTTNLIWEDRSLTVPVTVQPDPDEEIVRLLQGARLITDLDAQLGSDKLLDLKSSETQAAKEKHKERIMQQLAKLSQRYGLASRAMSLVAVIERQGDDDTKVPATRLVPVGLPQDLAAQAYTRHIGGSPKHRMLHKQFFVGLCDADIGRHRYQQSGASVQCEHFMEPQRQFHQESRSLSEADIHGELAKLAAQLLPDDGLPGCDPKERVFNSLALLFCCLAAGHSCVKGDFRREISQLIQFLNNHGRIVLQRSWLKKITACAQTGIYILPDFQIEKLLVMLSPALEQQHGIQPEPKGEVWRDLRFMAARIG